MPLPPQGFYSPLESCLLPPVLCSDLRMLLDSAILPHLLAVMARCEKVAAMNSQGVLGGGMFLRTSSLQIQMLEGSEFPSHPSHIHPGIPYQRQKAWLQASPA